MSESTLLLAKYHGNPAMRKKFIAFAAAIVTEERLALYQKIISARTRYVTVVLENLFQSQNASAILRSCECMGVQDVHVIENYNTFEVNSEIDMGASKWLSLYRYNGAAFNSVDAIKSVKNAGYRIVATTPHESSIPLANFDVTKGKFALLFGTERQGLTPEAIAMADEFVKIPMYGFIESYNVSVSVALCLYETLGRIRENVARYKLADDEVEDLLLQWLLLSTRDCKSFEKRFLQLCE